MRFSHIAILTTALISFAVPSIQAKEMSKEEILAEGEKMAFDWLEHLRTPQRGRSWVVGVFWSGFIDLAANSDDPKWLEAIRHVGDRKLKGDKKGENVVYDEWMLTYVDREKEPHHADDMIVGEAFLYLFEKTGDATVIQDVERRVDAASTYILSKEAAEKAAKAKELGWQDGITWYWSDAIFMAAPLHARLSAVTGNPKYREAMHVEWKRASDLLYDPEEHLYFRDKKFIDVPSKRGKKVFWSRGNGWVVAAFARVLPYLPKDDPQREWYIQQFKEMAAKMASIQHEDGTWSPSLVDFESYPFSELSCTALNCFGIAWGINEGILDDATYRPVVEKAWAAMLASRKDNEHGFMGYVQQVGANPARVHTRTFTWYGNGSFIMATAQLAKMAPLKVPEIPPLKGMTPEAQR